MQSRFSGRRLDSFDHYNGVSNEGEKPDQEVKNNDIVKKNTQKKGGLKSLKVLTAVLLSHIGRLGVRDLLSLVAIVVGFPFYDV